MTFKNERNQTNQINHPKNGMMKKLMGYNNTALVDILWRCDPEIFKIFTMSNNRHDARDKLFHHLNDIEGHIFSIYSDRHFNIVRSPPPSDQRAKRVESDCRERSDRHL